MKTFNRSTETKSVHQTTGTATDKQTTGNPKNYRLPARIYLVVITTTFCLAGFLHLLASDGAPGVMGWKYMISFLYSLQLPLLYFSSALIISFLASFTPHYYKSYFKTLAKVSLCTSVFYVLYSLIPMDKLFGINDYPSWIYYTFIIAAAIPAGYVIFKIQSVIVFGDESYKAAIRVLFRRIIVDIPETYISDAQMDRYEDENLQLIQEVKNTTP